MALHPETETTVFTVSELNALVREILESDLGVIWLQGEIADFTAASSGHWYFTLKDKQAQVSCCMFARANRSVAFQPAKGLAVLLRGQVSLYEPRGNFQVIAQHIEGQGDGLLRLAFEAVKNKLQAEGLFDLQRKRPLPPLPHCIGVVTSTAGAALQDVLRATARRAPFIPIIVYPASVQGKEAPAALVAAIETASRERRCDVLLVVRGGGSAEDLMAFNDEAVARAMAACAIPTVSGVGHEVDHTIADLVADHRAATPTMAAEMVTPDQLELARRLKALRQRLERVMRLVLDGSGQRCAQLQARLLRQTPTRRLEQNSQTMDLLRTRLLQAMGRIMHQREGEVLRWRMRLQAASPAPRLHEAQQRLIWDGRHLHAAMQGLLERRHLRLDGLSQKLAALAPRAPLQRGYAMVRGPEGGLLHAWDQVVPGDRVVVELAAGRLICVVEDIQPPPPQQEGSS